MGRDSTYDANASCVRELVVSEKERARAREKRERERERARERERKKKREKEREGALCASPNKDAMHAPQGGPWLCVIRT